MLIQRIITALVLLAILLPAMFYPSPVPFMVVSLLLLAAGAWEWGVLNGYSRGAALLLIMECMVLCVLAWKLGLPWVQTPTLWLVVGGAWVLLGVFLVRAGVPAWPRLVLWLRIVGGVVLLSLAWLAVAQARVRGINFLLSVLCLVWAADIFAYFAGKAFGRRKLAPAISPGKSWEGVWGGMVGVAVLAVGWIAFDRITGQATLSLYSVLFAKGWWLLLLGVIFLAAMSVVGDLLESLVKRSGGFKDSSNLLPGHGGVLDRVDALLPAVPLAMMLCSVA